MYCTDSTTGETLFAFAASTLARQVVLEGFTDNERVRVRMRRKSKRWTARVALSPGWFFYRFEVDGKTRWDRDAGRMKMQDGRPCSLALIHHFQVRRAA